MKRRLAIIGAVILSFILGGLLSDRVGLPGLEGRSVEDAAMDLPAAASKSWFPPIGEYLTGGEPLDEESFEGLMAALDNAMTAEETLADFEKEADLHLWNFIRRLSIPEVTPEQMERISGYFTDLAAKHPDHGAVIEGRRGLLDSYGKRSESERAPSFSGSAGMFPGDYDTDGGPFSDDQVDRLIARLDVLLNIPETLGDFGNEARLSFWRFTNRIQRGRIDAEQTARILAYLDEVKETRPESAELIDKQRYMIENLVPGQVAPNIVGNDTEGVKFSLEEYRGNVVVLVFSGQWCGPCRGEYPYQRAMMDLYKDKNEDVVILGVNSDAKLETIREAKKAERLPYRTWWDGHSQEDSDSPAATKGPIATEWNVTGWPDIYILDEKGVIRHVGKRGAEIIVAVDELLMEKRMREYEAERAAQAAAAVEAAAAAESDG